MDFAQQVKAAVNIVHVVGEHVPLRKQGANRFVGLCPFHAEKTPSFGVNESLQIYKCFGCGKGGDVFSFLMELQGVSFFEALKSLAEQHGIAMPKRGAGVLSDAESRLRSTLYRMHEMAQSLFERQLRSSEGAHARTYLEKRGLPSDVQKEFGLGYASSQGARLTEIFQREGISRELMGASGLVAKSEDGSRWYDRFRNRLIFPIHSDAGKVIAFAGRALESERQPKYLNSPKTAIYDKSSVLYNLHRAKQGIRSGNRAILVEGYMDVIGVHRAGLSAVVATCGTALTPRQARVLRRQAEEVVVNFDPDVAGQGAAHRSIEILLQEGLKVRVLTLPEDLDPDDFCRRYGGERYAQLVENAPDYFFWLADRAREQFDLRSSEGQVAAFQFLVPSIHRVHDKIQRASLATELAGYLGVETGLVLEQFRRAATERQAARLQTDSSEPFSKGEKLLLRVLISSPEARSELLERSLQIATEQDLPCCSVLAAIQIVGNQDGSLDYTAVEARLKSEERETLARLLFDRDSTECSISDGREALAALERQGWERRYRDVRRDILAAEKAGDQEKILELLHRKKELEKQGRGLGRLRVGAGAGANT